jgi:hypothetical protein
MIQGERPGPEQAREAMVRHTERIRYRGQWLRNRFV